MNSNSGETFGFDPIAWERAKREAICAIVRAGREENNISYSDLAASIASVRIEPHDYAMNRLLDEISKEEDATGRGILTALVVLKDKGVPAPGFWASAMDVGRKIEDRDVFWLKERERVIKECKNHPLCP